MCVCVYICACACVCVCDNACNTMTLYIFSGEGKKVSTVHQKSNPAKIRSSRVKPSVKAQSSWTWWNADVRALSPISILFFVDPFVSKLTSTRSSMFRPSFTGSEMRWDSAKFLFYFIYFFLFLGLILIVTFFFTTSLAKSYGLLSRMVRWSFEFRGGSEDFGQRRESSRKWKRVGKIRARSDEQWDIAISPEPARIFPSHSEPRDPAYLKVLKRVDDA